MYVCMLILKIVTSHNIIQLEHGVWWVLDYSKFVPVELNIAYVEMSQIQANT